MSSDGFERVTTVADFLPGTMKIVQAAGMDVMIANVDGSFYALPNRCTHVGGPLGKGRLVGSVVTCPLHGSQFDVKTGAVLRPPARVPEIPLQVKVEDSYIWVKKL